MGLTIGVEPLERERHEKVLYYSPQSIRLGIRSTLAGVVVEVYAEQSAFDPRGTTVRESHCFGSFDEARIAMPDILMDAHLAMVEANYEAGL